MTSALWKFGRILFGRILNTTAVRQTISFNGTETHTATFSGAQQVGVADPMTGETRQEWQYSERIIKWTLPQKYDSTEAVMSYLTGIRAEILDWAEATEMCLRPQ